MGRSDGSFGVPGVPVGPYLLQVGNWYVLTRESVVDMGEVMPGRRGLDQIDLSQNPQIPTTFDLQNLSPWQGAAAFDGAIGDRIGRLLGGQQYLALGVQRALLPAVAGRHDFALRDLRTSSPRERRWCRSTPSARRRADHSSSPSSTRRVSPTGFGYQAMTRVFSRRVTVAPGVALSLTGEFQDVSFASSVSIAWNFGAYHAMVEADATRPRSTTPTSSGTGSASWGRPAASRTAPTS
jgi:hypothetical protein